MTTLTIICQRLTIKWLSLKLRWVMRRYHYLLRRDMQRHSLRLRAFPAFPAAHLLEILLPIAPMHDIRFGECEMTFPVHPLVDELMGGQFPTRVVLYCNIVSIRQLNGFMWLISRSGHVYGFSTTTGERITDYMFPDVEKLRIPRWWRRLRMKG